MSREFHVDHAICRQRESRGVDAAIALLASRQHGVVDREQLLAIGLTEREIEWRVARGRLHRVHRGVYAVGHRRLSREGRMLAAVLSVGEGGVLSHRSAADLWELRAPKETRIDVIAPLHRRGSAGVWVRQSELDSGERTSRRGIPVTTPLRTLIDLAACVTQNELERAIRQGVYLRLTTTASLAAAVQRHAGRRGMKSLRKALVSLGEAPGLTRSDLEQRFVHFVRTHTLPMPKLNEELQIGHRRIEADCVWAAQRLIVELDGRDAHLSVPAFESDRARDSALMAAGWRVVRVTHRRLTQDAGALAEELRVLLL